MAPPHSPPLQGQWTQGGAGKVWVKSAAFLQFTNREFGESGQRRDYFFGGESEAVAIFTDVIVGITPRLDLWVQVPFLDLVFNDAGGDRRETGFGDIRAWARYQLVRLANGRLPIAVRAGAKAPIGSSPLNGEIIPLGQGQWDVEALAEAGFSFWPAPVYALTWFGYRARFENRTQNRRPGGEWVSLTEVGLNPGDRLIVKATLDGLWGRSWIIEGLEIPSARQRILTLQLGSGVRVGGPVWAEAAIRLPVDGQNFPAGVQWVFGGSARLR